MTSLLKVSISCEIDKAVHEHQKTETDRADELANGDGARHLELVELSQFVLWYC